MRILPQLATCTVLAATLSACGGSGTPTAPVAAPTELAAVDTPPPEYPIELACAGIGGVSTLKVVVGIEGIPTEVGVFKSSGQPALDEAAQKAVHGWQFKAATRNGRPIRVSDEADIGRSLLATGFSYDVRGSRQDNLDHFARLVKAARAVRRDGSAALDLCYVASGRLDGYWERDLSTWDVAAADVILREAGGFITSVDGSGPPMSPGVIEVPSIACGNEAIHRELLGLLKSAA